jgi:hypothetical protein
MIVVKRTDGASSWATWHRSLTQSGGTGGGAYNLTLESTSSQFSTSYINSTTSSDFTVGGGVGFFNNNGASYIAYIFAHNDGDGGFGPNQDQDIIKCGSYTGSGSDTGPEVDVGFEPGWLMIKKISGTAVDWNLFDAHRGFHHGWYASQKSTNDSYMLEVNNTAGQGTRDIMRLANGFQPIQNTGTINSAGETYIYVAIRHGTMFPPTDANQVWDYSVYFSNNQTHPVYNASFPPDMGFKLNTGGSSSYPLFWNRTGMARQTSNASSSFRLSDYGFYLRDNRGWDDQTTTSSTNTSLESWMWRNAPEFFHVLGYVGTGSGRTVNHNLGITPDMLMVRSWDSTPWTVWHKDFTSPTQSYAQLDSINAPSTSSNMWNNTAPTATSFSVNNNAYTNGSGVPYTAWLFGSVDGVSKCGTFNTATDTNIDCGFMNGSRWVMLKRINTGSSDWWVINANKNFSDGDELVYKLNSTGGSQSLNLLDPYTSGFKLTSTIKNATYGGTYVYYAIA